MFNNVYSVSSKEYGVGQNAIHALGLFSAADLENDLKQITESIKNHGVLPACEEITTRVNFNVHEQFLFARVEVSQQLASMSAT